MARKKFVLYTLFDEDLHPHDHLVIYGTEELDPKVVRLIEATGDGGVFDKPLPGLQLLLTRLVADPDILKARDIARFIRRRYGWYRVKVSVRRGNALSRRWSLVPVAT